jgi:1-acyl-sn-glycerol-3-phosphate acyltransferase
VFVNRERRTHVGAVNQEVEAALAAGALVVIFPEGTSSDGSQILPFRTSLLEPAARGQHLIFVSWLHYDLTGGHAGQEVCYWGDHSFFPHLLNLLGKKSIQATLRFAPFERTTGDRKVLAGELHQAVEALADGRLPAAD